MPAIDSRFIVFTSTDGQHKIAIPVTHITAMANCDLALTQLAPLDPGCVRLLLTNGRVVDVPGDFDETMKVLMCLPEHRDASEVVR